jgi:xanthine dehydrogenase accessory factor
MTQTPPSLASTDMDDIIAAAKAWADMPLALATVIDAAGSAPRPRGGHMLVAADGRFAGSISGGCVEYDVFAMADAVFAGAPVTLGTYGSADGLWQPGLPCGGQIGVLVQKVSAEGFAPALFETIAQSRRERTPLTLSTDLVTGKTVIGAVAGQFINVYAEPRRLLIVGAVQIAQALCTIAAATGFVVTVNDPRARFLTADRFPGVALLDAWPDEAVTAFAPDANAAVVTLSHDIKIDDPALIAALSAPT